MPRMVDHQGLERNVRGRKHREMEGFRAVSRWTHSKNYSKLQADPYNLFGSRKA